MINIKRLVGRNHKTNKPEYWIQITKEEYEPNKDDKDNYMLCFDQDTGKGGYYKKEEDKL